MSPEEQPTPPGSPKSSAMPTPSNFGLGDLYQTPVQTIIELEDEVMAEGKCLTQVHPWKKVKLQMQDIPPRTA